MSSDAQTNDISYERLRLDKGGKNSALKSFKKIKKNKKTVETFNFTRRSRKVNTTQINDEKVAFK